MDVFEHLIMLMIVRREVIHFAIKNQMDHLLGAPDNDENEAEDDDESSETTSFLSKSSMNDEGPDRIGSIKIKDEKSNKSANSSFIFEAHKE